MADFYIKKGDDEPALERILEDINGDVVNLSGASVQFLMKRAGATTPKVDAAAEIGDPATAGIVSYAWAAGDTDTEGEYDAEFQVTFAGGAVQTFPNDSYLRIRVTRDLG